MNRIIRYFNQNRKKVYISLIIIVFLFGLLQLLNVMAKNKKEEEKDTSGINEIMQNNINIKIISNNIWRCTDWLTSNLQKKEF